MQVDRQRQLLEEAWLGDAVLGLYARARILREDRKVDAEKFIRMTSNRFLNAIGEPASVEAGIGRVYSDQGLEAAFAWIEERVMPMFERQEQNRAKKRGS